MRIELEYGRDGLVCEVPDQNLVATLGLQPATPLADLSATVREAIRSPIGSASLTELAANKHSACIVVCDITRPVPNAHVLPPILEALEEAGIARDGITVLIATGTHRPNDSAEQRRFLGEFVVDRYKILNHICTDRHDMIALGESPNGVPIALNRHYVEADLKITCGMIEPHFMAGFAGGRKMVMPGVAALPTVQAWHSPKFLEHPLATQGQVEGNPVHEEALWIAKLARPDMIVDVSLDENKYAWGVFAGDLEQAWHEGVVAVREKTLAMVDQPVDIVITTCGGYPLDLTYYQTVKGMVGAIPIVKPGGRVIIASQCAEGIGNPHFRDTLFATERIGDFLPMIERPGWQPIADQWQIEELAKACRHAKISLVCDGISVEDQRRLFVDPFASVESALESALREHGPEARIAVIPKGPYVVTAIAPKPEVN